MINREILDYNLQEDKHKNLSKDLEIAYQKASQKAFHVFILMSLLSFVLAVKLINHFEKCYDNYEVPSLICIASWLFAIGYLFILGLKYKAYKAHIQLYLKDKNSKNYQKLWQTKLILNRYMLVFWILPLIYIVLLRLFLD